jgi:glucokinase
MNKTPGSDRPKSTSSRLLSFDIGGSHVAASARTETNIKHHLRLPLNHRWHREVLLASILEAGRLALADEPGDRRQLDGVAVAIPGPFEYETGISRMTHKFAELYGFDLKKAISSGMAVPMERILFLNDAEAFLLGFLAETPSARAMAVTLGTGIGSAFATEGTIRRTGFGVPPDGEVYCLPWGDGTVEDAISSEGIQVLHRQLGGSQQSVRGIAEASATDPLAAQTMRQFGITLGKVLQEISAGFRPERIVLGGSISLSADTFVADMTRSLAMPEIEVVTHIETEVSALKGGIAAWRRAYEFIP